MKHKTIITAFLLVLSFSATAQELGRLPDGRAFRTDTEGNQVVDYIAELEATVDALTKQVIAYEDAGASKITTCEPQACTPQVIKEEVRVPVDCPKAETQDCSNEIENIKAAKESEAKAKITLLNSEIDSLRGELLQKADNSNESEAKASLSVKLMEKEEEHTQALKEISSLKDALEVEKSKVAEIISVSAEEKARLVAAKQALEVKIAEKQNIEPVIVAKVVEQPKVNVSIRQPAELEPSDGFKSLKSTVLAETNRILSLQGTRDTLYASGKNQGSALMISPTLARSSDGKSLKALKEETIDASGLRDLLQIRKSLSEVRKILESDIEAIKRIQRVR